MCQNVEDSPSVAPASEVSVCCESGEMGTESQRETNTKHSPEREISTVASPKSEYSRREVETFKKIQKQFPNEFVSRGGFAHCRKCNIQVSMKSKNAIANVIRHVLSQGHKSVKGISKPINSFFKAKAPERTLA